MNRTFSIEMKKIARFLEDRVISSSTVLQKGKISVKSNDTTNEAR